jgi:hypothetical protein
MSETTKGEGMAKPPTGDRDRAFEEQPTQELRVTPEPQYVQLMTELPLELERRIRRYAEAHGQTPAQIVAAATAAWLEERGS